MKKTSIFGVLMTAVFLFSAFPYNKDNAFKNLKVLPTTTSSEQMDALMDAYCESLTVECSYCHVEGDMASDAKIEKEAARNMMRMTNEINEKYFGKNTGTIGCMTCHNGKVHP